jgi:pilus assembly protein CpaD
MSLNRIWFELWTKTLLVAAAFCLAALCLAACATTPESSVKSPALTAKTPGELYPLQAALKPDELALAVHPEGLSSAQVQALTALAARWREEGEDAIAVKAPHGGADPALSARTQSAARALLLSLGVPTAAIQLELYETADPRAPLLASFSRYQAKVPVCGRDWENLSATKDNAVQSNFGCAVSANMAAQIAHPADIVRPRGEDAPDAERRMTVMGRYAAGKTTAADDDPGKSGSVSRAVP